MQIHFLAPIRGGRTNQKFFKAIAAELQKHGTVHGAHFADDLMSEYGETHVGNQAIFDREMTELLQSDVVVADVSTPSLGVGYLIGAAKEKGIRVLCLYRGDHFDSLSAIIAGNPELDVRLYSSEEDIQNILAEEFSKK